MPYLRSLKILIVLVLLGFGGLLLWGYGRNHPEDLPWSELDLGRPVGAFTGRKLAALRDEPGRCRALLGRAGVRFTALPPRTGGQCGYKDAVRFRTGGAVRIGYRPGDLGTSCAVAAGLALWEWHVVQPAALEQFGTNVVAVEHFGSYSCRRIYGRSEGVWSEHATANAVDIAGFRLADGRRVTVVGNWKDSGAKGRVLHQVRDGACRLFATTLSPDYNAAHRDHLHLDQASRGSTGWRACR
ncbi:MAG TPA: extensin family protein [Allosphingosinicella sp.]